MLLFAHVQHMSSKFGPVISSSFVFARTAAATSAAILQVLSAIPRVFFRDPEYSITCAIVGRVVLEGMIARAPACSRLFAFVRALFCDVLHSFYRARACVIAFVCVYSRFVCDVLHLACFS